jgi:hypothetical protein
LIFRSNPAINFVGTTEGEFMGNLKMLGLLAVAAAGLTTFAGSASATTVTSVAGTTYTGSIEATSTNFEIDGPFVTVKCDHSSIDAEVEDHGSSVPVTGQITAFTLSECNYQVTIENSGSFLIESNGSFRWTFVALSLHSSVGKCTYVTNNNKLGSITGGANAVIDIGPGLFPRTSGSFLCGSSATATGSYTITTPSTLVVD